MNLIIVLSLFVVGAARIDPDAPKETFKGRLNPTGTQAAENLMRTMIRGVNDLIKQYVKIDKIEFCDAIDFGCVGAEDFRVVTLDTSDVDLLMDHDRLGVQMRNGRVHLTAKVYGSLGKLKVQGTVDVYGDSISALLDSALGVTSGGKLYSRGMGCDLTVGRPRVDIHCPLINHFVNKFITKMMPPVTDAVCEAVKKYGNGMINSVFKVIPTEINVFNLFRLHFPVKNFRSWSRHMTAGVGMEVRPVSNIRVEQDGIRRIPLPEAEDGHMACASISDYVINTAGRTFLPAGTSFQFDISSILQAFFAEIFKDAFFIEGTIASSPVFLAEPQELKLSTFVSCRLLDADGEVIPGTETESMEVKVTAPANEKPMFSNVKVKVIGPIKIRMNFNLANIIDMIISIIDKAFKKSGKEMRVEETIMMEKRAGNSDITRVMNRMFFKKYFSGLSIALSTRRGAILACMSGSPTSAAVDMVYSALRSSFYG